MQTRLSGLAGIAIVLMVLAASGRAVHAAPDGRRPNIIFILTDDLGYGDLGCFGQKKIKTPSIDRLAAEGMKFTQFYAGSTVCAPSRCVLMTGLHTGHARIRGNANVSLAAEDRTVASLLHDNGYRTALIGKWGLAEPGDPGTPTLKGFDYFFGYYNQIHAHNSWPAWLWRNETKVLLKNEVPPMGKPVADQVGAGIASKKVEFSNDLFADEALSFIDRSKDGPFFLYLAITSPHANNEAKAVDVPDQGEYAKENWPEQEKNKAAVISRSDRDVGRIMKKLQDLNLEKNTLVIFSSDNGAHAEGGVDPTFFHSSGPLRGIKRAMYEGGIRVPTIAHWPGRIKPGSESEHVAGFQDFLATAAEVIGVDAPKTDGVSFLPALIGQADKQQKHDYLYWEFYEGKGSQAVRFGDWKAVRPTLISDKLELYDLKTDLGEKTNVAGEHPDLIERAETIMKQAHTQSEVPDWQLPSERPKGKATPLPANRG